MVIEQNNEINDKKVLLKSALGKAMLYTYSILPRLKCYTERGDLLPDRCNHSFTLHASKKEDIHGLLHTIWKPQKEESSLTLPVVSSSFQFYPNKLLFYQLCLYNLLF